MRNIKIKIISLMLIVIMMFTGCLKEEYSFKINSDGSSETYICRSIDLEEIVSARIKVCKVLGLSDQEIGTKEKLQETYSESYKQQGYKETTIDGKTYYQKTAQYSNDKKNLTRDITGNDGYVTTDTFYYIVNWKDSVVNSIESQAETIAKQNGVKEVPDAMQLLKQAGVDLDTLDTCVATVEFPKPIVSTNGIIDSKNKNKVTFTIKATENKTLFATTDSKVTFASAQAKYKADNTIKKPKIKQLKANKVKRKAKKATITLKFGKVAGAKMYQVQYATKSSFKSAKTKNIKKTTYKISNLKKNKKYYVRVRAWKSNMARGNVFSGWVKKSVKTKK